MPTPLLPPVLGIEPDCYGTLPMDGLHLSRLLDEAAARRPDHTAVLDEHGRTLSFAALRHGADRLATRLARWGAGRGDRVGLWLPKSLQTVTAIHGILRSGAAYVPVDPTGPALRAASIFTAAGVKAVVVDSSLAAALRDAWRGSGPLPRLILVVIKETEKPHARPPQPDGTPPAGSGVGDAHWTEIMADDAPSPLAPCRDPDDLAYILFTSGSTGQPKGVMLSHANAFTFLDWCQETLGPWADDDRFSSHAPFHFDLSVFDLFVSCRNAATLVLIGESLAKEPELLGEFVAAGRISVWYSAPSILALLARHGRLDRPGSAAPRLVLFAGEVFPVGPLRRLRQLWPAARLWNLYGPTETNVCTAHPIPAAIPDDRTEPYPIGTVCPPLRARVVDEEGQDVPAGALGELVIAGPGVMRGYFGQPELAACAFFIDAEELRWYRTGDLVVDDGASCYQFHGRRDRMVKKRGYRIELGEIESALYRHDGVDRAAVVARADESGVSIAAFVALKPEQKRSIIAMKRHCTVYLPNYMVPDTITFMSSLPATSTDKVDYQRLGAMAADQR
ncbi:MAG: amino acid adenylation domain-containing protein [Planctomycetaceae bacterium]|nr:amino acid adenylation domain-containing protein [Planctomycetaceae bacterium]